MSSSSSFPLHLVQRADTRSGLWQARRAPGQVQARARYRCGARTLAETRIQFDGEADDEARLTARLAERAFHLVLRRSEATRPVRDLLTALGGQRIELQLMRGHDRLIDLAEDGTVRLACDVAPALGLALDADKADLNAADPDVLRGFDLLLALGHLQVLSQKNGLSQRQALHRVLDLYAGFSRPDRARLLQLLAGAQLDSGNLFQLFLRQATAMDEDADERRRDRCITWLLGQDRIDLPYNRQAALEILNGPDDPDEKRFLLYALLRSYDRDLEAGNIARIAAQVRQAGQQLVFGRMSRAFHNQGTLFADAVLLSPRPAWRRLAARLRQATADSPDLAPQTQALRLLLEGDREIPLMQLEGACERFEEAVLEDQQRQALAFLQGARRQLEDHGDEAPLALQKGQSLPSFAASGINAAAEGRLALVEDVRQALMEAPRRRAAYVVISQRPSPTGSHLLVKINEFEEPYLGKAANLRKLARLAGDQVYSSPDYRWLEVADHWVEAIPLFIKEEVQVEDGRERTRTVIDIAGMEESFREEMADRWADNIRRVLRSEWLCLGRELVVDGTIAADEPLDAAADRRLIEAAQQQATAADVAAAAALCAALYRRHIVEVQRLVETQQTEPFEALRQVLGRPLHEALRRVLDAARDSSWPEAARQLLPELAPGAPIDPTDDLEEAFQPRRPLPTLHVLTTQSAGMTEGYIRTWLEESMALYNAVLGHGLQEQVEARQATYAERLGRLGERVIRQLGIWVDVEETAAREQIPAQAAVDRVLNANGQVRAEVARLAVLLELEAEEDGVQPDYDAVPRRVETLLREDRADLETEALADVEARNGETLRRAVEACRQEDGLTAAAALRQVVEDDPDYRADLDTFTRMAARRRALQQARQQYPDLHLEQREAAYLRRYQRLRKTTARKEVLAARGLNHLSMEPLYYWQATGGRKRFHLLYTPSRVDLGERERESVETWSQWVGGADRAAARVGRQIYGLINKNVRSYDSLTEPEVLKTGENASMASHFAFSNALSLMVTATRHGDIEEMGDQMSRRRDRLIHPAGEAYGGYCVPKDGLFLEFVLSLGRSEKLRQLGLDDAHHDGVVALARHLLERQGDFADRLDWEAWAAQYLAERQELAPYFSRQGDLPVFQITRIAHVLDHLGQPELRDPERLATSLAARWGIHKMVAGGEHVNRFMPFFKTWLLRRGVEEAKRLHPELPIAADGFTAVLSAEYKPDTQDGRFAAGMRKFEILAGTGQHLLYALDADGQALALLLHEGYEGLVQRGKGDGVLALLGLDPDDVQAQQVAGLFPTYKAPAEIRVVSPTGLSTQDLLGYTSDTRLEEIAEECRRALLEAGYGEGEIEANLHVYGPRLSRWDHQAAIDAATVQSLQHNLGGRLHALHLAVVGPDPSYLHALQGADVLDTGIPHRVLLELLDDPARVCDLMLAANPNSALVLVDGASGARRRALNRLDVMLWFAAAERLGRQSVYLGIGLGHETVEAWRADMRRQRQRATDLGAALHAQDGQRAARLYARLVEDLHDEQAVQTQLEETDKLRRFGRQRPRDYALGEALARVGGGLPLDELSFTDFLALGGLFLLNGLDAAAIDAYRRDFAAGIQALKGSAPTAAQTALPDFLHARFQPEAADFREEKGVESSNKAAEEQASVALEARSELAARIARAQALNQRQQAFAKAPRSDDFETAYDRALAALGDGGPVSEEAFGTFLAHARDALVALGGLLFDENSADEADEFAFRVGQLLDGREVDDELWRQIAGGYEDIGDFGRMAQGLAQQLADGAIDAAERDRRLDWVARGGELFYILLALEQTVPFTRPDAPADAAGVWRALADFFAETINDHFYDYRPWLYDRGIGFDHITGEALYDLAAERHRWLHRYLRGVVVGCTEVADLPAAERDALLGHFLDDNSLDGHSVEAIGAGASGPLERVWRSYGQLRELAFIRNDGFPLPVVFPRFAPELIEADKRVNHVIALPVGRTHYSRALQEGPTLSRQLTAQGRPGANLIISRWLEVGPQDGYHRPVARVHSGHLYIDAATYVEALVRHKGLDRSAAEDLAAAVPPKGVRVAAAFETPLLAAVVYPFHGDPRYAEGAYEACGLPYSVQSIFHTWTTYDKAKYPDIFPPSTGVDLPDEIDWLASYSERGGGEAQVKGWIADGLDGTPYPGLRDFARRHRLVMIKDAAESGGRNAQAFVLKGLDGRLDEGQLDEAVDFIYQIARRHNVAIQEVILSSPEYWATEAFMRRFVRRQLLDWHSPVERDRQPRTPIYGSHRIILTTDDPQAADAEGGWHLSHWITLNSKQLITNVGRGGTLEQFLPEFIQENHRRTLRQKLEVAGRRTMAALAAYGQRAAQTYRQESGREIGVDLTGVSYAVPRYMMLDFLIAPVFDRDGTPVDVCPEFDADGVRTGSTYLLQEGDEFFSAKIVDWRVVLIEPNIGVGLWDRVALRETERETDAARVEGRPVDWDRIGVEARTVLADLSRAGEAYLEALSR